jgi:RNA polymerase sigma-70 factor, ECF subfamily
VESLAAEFRAWPHVCASADIVRAIVSELPRPARERSVDHTADLQLVARMLAGDEEAFEAFGERYFKALYRFAFGRLRGDRDLTREIVQTAVAKALAKLDAYRGEASLLTWLCACCRNEILMHFRRQRSAPAGVELGDEELAAPIASADRQGDPEAALLSRERARRVHMALDALPDHYARALEWKYLDRLSVQEIAARLGMGAKAAESLLTRARQAFRTGYEDLRVAGRGEG